MSGEIEELSLAAKLEILRQTLPLGVATGYDPAGERAPVVIPVVEFAPARMDAVEMSGGSPVITPDFDDLSFGGGGAASYDGSWELTVAADGEVQKYQVSSEGSTIQNLTNGPLIDLGAIFAVPAAVSATKYVSLKVEVHPTTGVFSDWAFDLTDDRPDEVEFDESSPYNQVRLRLLIGKITFTDGVPSVEQIARLPQRIVMIFLNGKICKGITSV